MLWAALSKKEITEECYLTHFIQYILLDSTQKPV